MSAASAITVMLYLWDAGANRIFKRSLMNYAVCCFARNKVRKQNPYIFIQISVTVDTFFSLSAIALVHSDSLRFMIGI